MENNQKRKRKRKPSETERTPAKRGKRDEAETPKTPNTPKKTPKKSKGTPKSDRKVSNLKGKTKPQKKKKLNKIYFRRKNIHVSRRPRLNDLRQKVARTIERALVEAPKIPLIYHLFTERDSMGTPRAPLRQVLRTLKISDFVKNTHLLKDNHMKSLTNYSTLFAIEEDEPHSGLYVKHWPIFDKDEATVYVDNLPEGCCEAKLMRLAECYGTVAELSVGRKGARWVRPKHHPKKKQQPGQPPVRQKHRNSSKKKPLINVGSRPKSFGFIRFVDPDSASQMIREFVLNDPSIFYQKMEDARKIERERSPSHDDLSDEVPDFLIPGEIEELEPVVPQEFPRPRPYFDLYMTKLIRELRFLKMRRKRRPWPMYMRLYRLERRFNDLMLRERRCLRRAGIIEGRKKLRKNQRLLIRKAFPPEASVPSVHPGRAPPPSSPRNNEPSTSDGRQSTPEDVPFFINKSQNRKKKNHNQKKKTKLFEKKDRKPKRKNHGEKLMNGVPVKKKKKRRKRKKMSRKLAKFIPGGQVRRFFQDIQVLSLKKYRELKEEYQELVRKEKERVREEAEAPPPAPEPNDPEDPIMDVPDMNMDL
uniref:RRM domain-containing protein n=1 Tax=Caenorhabditis tropicalis TaxID=1561998 RepID=A0A1I7SZJ9_9PELO